MRPAPPLACTPAFEHELTLFRFLDLAAALATSPTSSTPSATRTKSSPSCPSTATKTSGCVAAQLIARTGIADPRLPAEQTYYRTATLPLLRSYFSCLFRALAATHNLQIIHRDVKPANFLFDITTGQGVLCDYGLAQKIGGDEWFEWKSDCLHSLPGPSWGGVADRKRVQNKLERLTPGTCPGLCAGLHGARLAKPLSLYDQALAMEREWKAWEDKLDARQARGVDVTDDEWDAHDAYRPWIMPVDWRDDIKKRIDERRSFYKSWRPALQVMQLKGKQRPGYLKEDRRPSVRANRAGTRGFRAPEVLLKCPDQTVGASSSSSSSSPSRGPSARS